MSGRSVTITIGTAGSIHTASASVVPSNGVKLAGEESKDKMYEPKHSKKMVRVLTVIAYMFAVSLAAIMLSVYYTFLWTPRYASSKYKTVTESPQLKATMAMNKETSVTPTSVMPTSSLSALNYGVEKEVTSCSCPGDDTNMPSVKGSPGDDKSMYYNAEPLLDYQMQLELPDDPGSSETMRYGVQRDSSRREHRGLLSDT